MLLQMCQTLTGHSVGVQWVSAPVPERQWAQTKGRRICGHRETLFFTVRMTNHIGTGYPGRLWSPWQCSEAIWDEVLGS